MKATTVKRALMLVFALAFISMAGFSQTDDQKELAKKASLTLTESMTEALKLTSSQKDAVDQCNASYTLILFTSEDLSDEATKAFEVTLDNCLKEVLDENQYKLWTESKNDWLDNVKKDLPVKEEQKQEQKEEQDQYENLEIF